MWHIRLGYEMLTGDDSGDELHRNGVEGAGGNQQ